MSEDMMDTADALPLSRKQAALNACLGKFDNLGVALSGGVDSTLLVAAALQVLGDRVVAFSAQSPIHPSAEMQNAADIARELGVRHVVFASSELDDPLFSANSSQRCYHCKKRLFSAMRIKAADAGVQVLAHGANMDDLSDFRPGFKAAQELGIEAPLIAAGLSKADIRALARQMGLSNWDRPAMACLASRIPYGTAIEASVLARIDEAETFLRRLGAVQCRVRHYGSLARIEIDSNQIALLAESHTRKQVVRKLRELGYAHICLDLEGYAPGKMNRDLLISW